MKLKYALNIPKVQKALRRKGWMTKKGGKSYEKQIESTCDIKGGERLKKAILKARCVDCAWKDLIDKEGGRTRLSWFCPRGGIYMIASERSLHARRKCTVFTPEVEIVSSSRSCRDWRKTIQEKYGNFLQVAAQGERRCRKTKRGDFPRDVINAEESSNKPYLYTR